MKTGLPFVSSIPLYRNTLIMTTKKIELFKRSLKIIAGVGTVSLITINVWPHLFPKESVNLVHGLPPKMVTKPHPKYQQLLIETCKLMEIDPERIELTHSKTLSTVSAGCLLFPNKSVVVLPRNALYTHADNLVHSGICFHDQKPVDWNSKTGEALKEVLLLNDNEMRFLIGHELTHIQNMDFLLNTVHGVSIYYTFYKLGNLIPKLFKRPTGLGFHIFLTVTVWLLGAPLYFLTKKPLSHYFEYAADESSAKLGENYCLGGISYTRKRLKLNRILRATSENGVDTYSEIGNSKRVFDQMSHPKRTERLKKLKEIWLNDYNNE